MIGLYLHQVRFLFGIIHILSETLFPEDL